MAEHRTYFPYQAVMLVCMVNSLGGQAIVEGERLTGGGCSLLTSTYQIKDSDTIKRIHGEAHSLATKTTGGWVGPDGELFAGTYNEVRAANLASGLNATHTPHHVVQAAISNAGSRGAGVAINLRKDLHTLTRTFCKPVDPTLNLRTHLARDIRDLRRILHAASYTQAMINRQLQELIRQNKALGGFEK